MRFLARIFVHNAGLKLIALAISFFLWASYTAEPFAQVAYTVPIAFVNVPEGFAVAGDAPNAVRVVLRGRSGLLRRLTPTDLVLDVDLGSAPSDDTAVHISDRMVRVPYGTDVVRITPSQFRISLVRTATPPSPPE
jgi:hypothetical protein